MSRTRKGCKGPGWEPWSNRHEKELERARSLEADADEPYPHWSEDICPGCRRCRCLKCGGYIVTAAIDVDLPVFACIDCGEPPPVD